MRRNVWKEEIEKVNWKYDERVLEKGGGNLKYQKSNFVNFIILTFSLGNFVEEMLKFMCLNYYVLDG